MNKIIVTTTINHPTEAIIKFDDMEDWKLVVVGDIKTPEDYALKNGIYITPQEQEEYDKQLSDLIGWNCIQRRNFGLLWAKDMKADIVAVIDDDNIPLDGWGKDLMIGKTTLVKKYLTNLPAFDPVGATNYPYLWHRGFPLQLLPDRDYTFMQKEMIIPDVQADFWNGDPDIDAICRMQFRPECKFNPSLYPIASNQLSPFNSQNTFLKGDFIKNYFLFPHIGRMDDIWASYYIQAKGAKVVYGKPSVYQQRNEHDLVVDMKLEYIGYENNLRLLKEIKINAANIFKFLPDKAQKAFDLYKKHFI